MALANFGGIIPGVKSQHLAWRDLLQHLALGLCVTHNDHCFNLLGELPALKTLLLEQPGCTGQLFGRQFVGSPFQAQKEIERRFEEIWERQIQLKIRNEMPIIQWITSRKLQKKVDGENVSLNIETPLEFTRTSSNFEKNRP